MQPLASAKHLRASFEANGVPPDRLRANDLSEIYTRLRRIPSTPNFDGIDAILPKTLPAVARRTQDPAALIVETRCHPNLVPNILDVVQRLGLPVQLFHGLGNRDHIASSALAPLIAEGRLVLSELNAEKLDASRYNALFLTPSFWDHVIARGKVLVFQTDAVLCANSDYRLSDFLDFDYIGSEWLPERPIGLSVQGGNGGLSLRDIGRTTQCLAQFDGRNWVGSEDTYFAFHMDLIGARVASQDECARFSTQRWYRTNSFGAHDIAQLSTWDLVRFLVYAPESRKILPPDTLSLRSVMARLKRKAQPRSSDA